MAASGYYLELLQKFVDAFLAGDKAKLSSLIAEEVKDNDSTISKAVFVDDLMSAFNVAAPHSLTVDMTTVDPSKKAIATRLLHKGVLVQPYLGTEVTGEEVEWPEHLVLWFNDDGKIVECHAAFLFGGPTKISDRDVKVRPTQEHPPISPPDGFDLEKAYLGYIEANNTHTIRDYFPHFIQDPILNNGTQNSLEKFIKMIESNWEALKGVKLRVKHLLVDAERQHIVADLQLTATPVKEFHGVPPNGKPVTFGEIAMYKFNGGKVEQVWVVLDLRGLEQ